MICLVEIFVLIYFGWDIWVNVHEDNMNIQISSQAFAKQCEENPNQALVQGFYSEYKICFLVVLQQIYKGSYLKT